MKTYLIVNKVHHKEKKVQLRKNIEKAFKLPIGGFLPMSDDILLSQSQFIFSERYPEHEFSYGIRSIVANVFGIKPKEHMEIMHDLLISIAKGEKPPKQYARYVTNLLSERFIQKSKEFFIITEKGRKFLNKYKTIRKFVDNFRL